ncbi:MAG: methionyl-tRNA formyltransferase [Dehalococcoidales bacterium]|jgi:methionyl-tRNA formyltransferase
MRIVFMGSPRFAVPSLEQLLDSGREVAAVYTQPDRPAGRGRGMTASAVKEEAAGRGLKIMQPESVRTPEALAELAALKPDVIVVCAFGQILPQALLDIPPFQCLNVHFSLLPRHRGASPAAAAILAGDAFSGVTVQLVRKKLDTGPVLAAAAVPISPLDNTGTLADKLAIIGAHLLEEALTGWLRGEIAPRVQDEAGASYFGQVKKEEGEIDWKKPAAEIWRRVRAYYPWPGCFTTWRGKQLKINEAAVMPGENNLEPGRVIALPGDGGLGIAAGEGILKVLRIQYEGKKAMTADEFIRGQRDFTSSLLPG